MRRYQESYSGQKFALLLSGGYDSRSILYICEQLKIDLHCYTYTLSDRLSTDANLALSEAKKSGYDCTLVTIPRDANELLEKMILLAYKYKCTKKTEFECVLPLLYLHDAIDEKVILVGTDSDNYFACGSKYGLHYRQYGDLGLMRYKQDKPKNNDSRYDYQEIFADAEFDQRMMLCEEYGQIELDPYNTKQMYDVFDNTTWNQVNKPKNKFPIYETFKNRFDEAPAYRMSYQCGDSGIREFCAEVLLDSKYNTKRFKSVVGCYNELVKQYGGDVVVRKLI